MYKVMVVDDEPHVVNAIFELLSEQNAHEIEVYKAYSALEAIACLERLRMDIVISDIRMPRMSGLELMEYIRAYWTDTRIIFLTGYDEFDYVYSAIAKEGVSYILKTEDDDVLLAAVEQAVQAINQRNQAILTTNLQRSLLRLLQYRDIVAGYAAQRLPYAQLTEKLASVAPSVRLQADVALMAARLDAPQDSRFHLYAGIEHIMADSLCNRVFFLQADASESIVLWLAQSTGEREALSQEELVAQLRSASDRIIDACCQHWDVPVSFAIARRSVSWQDVPRELDVLIKNTGLNAGLETGRVVLYDPNDPQTCPGSFPTQPWDDAAQSREPQHRKSGLISSIESYIECNIAGDLSLTAISEALHYNPSYLSRMFKQLTGGNLLSFIVEKRLERAVRMLSQGSEPIYVVGRSVGFDSPAYFAKVFRRTYGSTPQEYREKNMRF